MRRVLWILGLSYFTTLFDKFMSFVNSGDGIDNRAFIRKVRAEREETRRRNNRLEAEIEVAIIKERLSLKTKKRRYRSIDDE